MTKIRYCPLCKSNNIQERFDRPSGINIGGAWYLCKDCGHKSLSMPLIEEREYKKKFYKKNNKKIPQLNSDITDSQTIRRQKITSKDISQEHTRYTEGSQLRMLIASLLAGVVFTIYDNTFWVTFIFPIIIALNILYQKYKGN